MKYKKHLHNLEIVSSKEWRSWLKLPNLSTAAPSTDYIPVAFDPIQKDLRLYNIDKKILTETSDKANLSKPNIFGGTNVFNKWIHLPINGNSWENMITLGNWEWNNGLGYIVTDQQWMKMRTIVWDWLFLKDKDNRTVMHFNTTGTPTMWMPQTNRPSALVRKDYVDSVAWENWTWEFKTHPITITGSTGWEPTNVTGFMRYKVIGKICFVEFRCSFEKWTLSGRPRIQLPIPARNGWEIMVNAILGWPWTTIGTQVWLPVLQWWVIDWLRWIGQPGSWLGYPDKLIATWTIQYEIN